MVEVIKRWARKWEGLEAGFIEGELRVKSGDRVYSYDLGLKTIYNIVMTPDVPQPFFVHVQKYLNHPGYTDNYASVWLLDANGSHISTQRQDLCPGGSVWLNFHAFGQ